PKLGPDARRFTDFLMSSLRKSLTESEHQKAVEEFRQLEPKLVKALDRFEVHGQVKADKPMPSMGVAASRALRPLIADFAGWLLRLEDPSQAKAVHRSRVCAKRVRYLLEAFDIGLVEESLQHLKELQDLLGDQHDVLTLEMFVASQDVKASS